MSPESTMKAILSVAIPNIGALAISMLTNIELVLKVMVLSVTLGYGVWKWIHDYKKGNKNGNESGATR